MYRKFLTASAHWGPASGTDSSILFWKLSSVMSVRAIPTTANSGGSRSRHARLASAGMSLRLVRSPDAPKITKTPGGDLRTSARDACGAVVTAASVGAAPGLVSVAVIGYFSACDSAEAEAAPSALVAPSPAAALATSAGAASFITLWPPNSLRRAATMRAAKELGVRDEKRSKR